MAFYTLLFLGAIFPGKNVEYCQFIQIYKGFEGCILNLRQHDIFYLIVLFKIIYFDHLNCFVCPKTDLDKSTKKNFKQLFLPNLGTAIVENHHNNPFR